MISESAVRADQAQEVQQLQARLYAGAGPRVLGFDPAQETAQFVGSFTTPDGQLHAFSVVGTLVEEEATQRLWVFVSRAMEQAGFKLQSLEVVENTFEERL